MLIELLAKMTIVKWDAVDEEVVISKKQELQDSNINNQVKQ